MLEFNKPNLTSELSDGGKHGIIVMEPLERGYGTTLGNSLRRVLLSSTPGCAVTSIKIDGVLHEFSTIPGVKEDVTEIVLNVKGIIAKMETKEPKTVVIDVVGERDVTDADIKTDADLIILNPKHHIATVAEGCCFYSILIAPVSTPQVNVPVKALLCSKEAWSLQNYKRAALKTW